MVMGAALIASVRAGWFVMSAWWRVWYYRYEPGRKWTISVRRGMLETWETTGPRVLPTPASGLFVQPVGSASWEWSSRSSRGPGILSGSTITVERATPLWLPVLGVVGIATGLCWWRWRGRRREGECPGCGYDLAGLEARVACPECGVVRGEGVRAEDSR